MDKTKIGEVATHTVDELQKVALSFIPGGAILDGFLGFRSRLKQKRIIDFSDGLRLVLQKHLGRELTASDFENEDFIDVMESVYNEVLITQSRYKLERFKSILAKQVIAPIEIDESLKFVHILKELQDADLAILSAMRHSKDYSEVSVMKLLTGVDGLIGDEYPIELTVGQKPIKIVSGELEFYINKLTTIGLLRNRTVNRPADVRGKKANILQYQSISISKMGKKFLTYIESYSTND